MKTDVSLESLDFLYKNFSNNKLKLAEVREFLINICKDKCNKCKKGYKECVKCPVHVKVNSIYESV